MREDENEEIEKFILEIQNAATYRGGQVTLPAMALESAFNMLRTIALTVTSSGVKKCVGCESGEVGTKPDPRGFPDLLCSHCADGAQDDIDKGCAEIAPGFTPTKTPKPQPPDPVDTQIAKVLERISITEVKAEALATVIEAQNARISTIEEGAADLRKRISIAAKALGKDS